MDDLVREAARGDSVAFDELVQLYRPGVIHACRQVLRSREEIEDAAQETFVLAYRALGNLREPEKFAGWLFAIARRTALRLSVATPRHLSFEDSAVLERLPSIVAEPFRLADWVTEGIQDLPEEFGRPAVLHYLEGWPVAKIADVLDLTNTTVKWRLHRARELLRQRQAAAEEAI